MFSFDSNFFQEKLLVRRRENQKVAAFNLGVAEATAEKKQLKEDFTVCFVRYSDAILPIVAGFFW